MAEQPTRGFGENASDIPFPTGDYYFLGIAINEYKEDSLSKLSNPTLDVKNVFNILKTKYGFEDISENGSCILENDKATLKGIFEKIKEMLKKKETNLVVYFAGHGEEDGWVPYDADKEDVYLRIYYNAIKKYIKKATTENNAPRHIALIADTCYSGGNLRGDSNDANRKNTPPKNTHLPTRFSFTSSNEKAFDGVPNEGSPFANSLCHFLKNEKEEYVNFETLCGKVRDDLKNGKYQEHYTDPKVDILLDCGHDVNGKFCLKNRESQQNSAVLVISPSPLVKEKNTKILKELAWSLAYNHVTISFGNRYRTLNPTKNATDKHVLKDDVIEEILNFDKATLKQERCRNIVIVGRGFTENAFPTVPYSAERIMKYLVNSLKNNEKSNKNKENSKKEQINEVKNYVGEKFGKEYNKLEQLFDANEIKKIFKNMYGLSYTPNLSFELLAHMLKHGFVDAIINFNLDELLDRAIEGEIGTGFYKKIVSIGDSMDLSESMVDGRIKVPLYIKPLGTASNIDSFKADASNNEKELFVFQDGIKQIVEDLLQGTMHPKSDDNFVKNINLICIGFNIGREDIKPLIKDKELQLNFNIYNFNTVEYEKKFMEIAKNINTDKQLDLAKEAKDKIVVVDNFPIISKKIEGSPNSPNTFSFVLNDLWEEVCKYFKDNYKPRDISRHIIVSSLFYDYKDWNIKETVESITEEERAIKEADPIALDKKYSKSRTSQYYFDRTIIELAMVICRNKGILDPKQITVDRFGRHFRLFKESTAHLKNREKGDIPFTLYDFLRRIFRMREYLSFAGNIYSISEPTDSDDGEFFRYKRDERYQYLRDIFNYESSKDLYQDLPMLILFRILDGLTEETFKKRYDEDGKKNIPVPVEYKNSSFIVDNLHNNSELLKLLYDNLTTLHQRVYYDIHPNFKDNQLLIFDSFDKNHILNTDVAHLYEYMRLFQDLDSWDTMYTISERGAFLAKYGYESIKNDPEKVKKLKEKKIIIICCHEMMKQQLGNFKENDKGIEKDYMEQILKIDGENDIKGLDIEIYGLPYFVYDHHLCVFLKRKSKIAINGRDKYEAFLSQNMRTLYYYHKGFSQKINPVLFDPIVNKNTEVPKTKDEIEWFTKALANDNKKFVELMYALYEKGKVFKKKHKILHKIIKPEFKQFDKNEIKDDKKEYPDVGFDKRIWKFLAGILRKKKPPPQ